MHIGFSLSPGGLLLPYHVGVLSALQYNGVLTDSSPIAGSSAGAIATVAHGAGLDPRQVLEATIRISDECEVMGGARGRLLPLLKREMQHMIDDERFEQLLSRQGLTGVCYRELFPRNVPVLHHEFTDQDDMIKAVCASCSFPFFASNWPVILDTSTDGILPRVLVDGFFAVPRERFGCPDFEHANLKVDRTVHISTFPDSLSKLDLSISPENRIGPSSDDWAVEEILRLATQTSSREELTKVYEAGWADGEEWCSRHAKATTASNMATLDGTIDLN